MALNAQPEKWLSALSFSTVHASVEPISPKIHPELARSTGRAWQEPPSRARAIAQTRNARFPGPDGLGLQVRKQLRERGPDADEIIGPVDIPERLVYHVIPTPGVQTL